MNTSLTNGVLLALLLAATTAQAKLPPPSDEAKAKAAEAAAKAAYSAKVDNYKTCLSAEKAAAHYFKTHPGAAKPRQCTGLRRPGPLCRLLRPVRLARRSPTAHREAETAKAHRG